MNKNMKKLLVVVDYQNDFIYGSLKNDNALKIYPYLLNLVKKFKNNDDIIFTLDTHYDESYFDSIEGKNLPVKHCIKGSEGHKLYKELEEISKDYIKIEKETFPGIKLINYLKNNNKEYEEILVCGVITNICVISNAILLKSIYPNTPIIIDSKACASNDLTLEKESFDIMKNLHFIIK